MQREEIKFQIDIQFINLSVTHPRIEIYLSKDAFSASATNK